MDLKNKVKYLQYYYNSYYNYENTKSFIINIDIIIISSEKKENKNKNTINKKNLKL